MNIGAMNHIIAIERKTETKDANGAMIATWPPIASVWADKRPVSGREMIQGDRPISSEVASFYTHWIDGVTVKDRINEAGRIWNIRYVREVRLHEGLEIVAEAIA